jgi:hypothetical protein
VIDFNEAVGKRPSAALPSSLVPPGRRPSGPEALRRTSMYASFLGISEALHMDIFHQPPEVGFSTLLMSRLNIQSLDIRAGFHLRRLPKFRCHMFYLKRLKKLNSVGQDRRTVGEALTVVQAL